jgi:release factor glutamine methyltransferase
MSDKFWTIGELLKWAAEDFKKRGIETARLDAEVLLAEALGLKRMDLYLRFEQEPPAEPLGRFRELVRRRREREPVAHILCRRDFHAIQLFCPPGRFVPRAETELLVDEAVSRLKTLPADRPPRVLDLCAGTGAVGLAVARAVPAARVALVDVDPEAGAVVNENIRGLGLSDRADFRAGDLFAPVTGGVFDVVVSNPPYIASDEIDGLMPEVSVHEPRLALDGGTDGLDVVRRLLLESANFLAPGGWLLLEVGEGQAETAAALPAPGLCHEASRADIRGCLRVVVFRRT